MKKITFLIVLLALFFSWYGTAQITSYPYSEDFEAGAGGWVANNATNGTWALGAPTANVINSAASGANAWATNLSGNYNTSESSSVQSPVFDFSGLSAPSIEFSIWWNAESSWDGMVLQSSINSGTSWQNVGALGDPNNWYNDNTIGGNPGGQQIGWTGRVAVSNDGSNGWRVARHALTGLAGQSNVIFRFAFGSDTSVEDNGVAFDLVTIFEVTCPEPSGLVVNSQTSSTATISWTAGGSETDWEVVVQPVGTGVPTGSGDPTSSNVSYVAMGLSPATNYEVYVRSSCGGQFSPWVGSINFTTECVNFTAPYSEGFENAGTIPLCWSMSGGEIWRFSNTGGFDHIGNNGVITGSTATNGYFAWVDSSGSEGPATLLSPLVDVSGLTTPALSFYEISNNEGNANSTLTVDVWDGAAWNNVGVYNTNTSGWELKIIDLSALTITGDVQVRFVFSETVSTDFYDDIAIDDVRFDEAPLCIIPSGLVANNVGGTTATVTWNGGTSTAWEYVIQSPGTGVPTGNGTPLTVTTVNETGLTFSTAYEVYVRTDCGANGFSDWVGPLTFTTTIETDFIVDCAVGPLNASYCYGNDNDLNPAAETFLFTSSDGSPIRLTFNSGLVESCCDELVVLDSDGSELFNGTIASGDLSGLEFQSTGTSLSFYINSDISVSCESGSFPDGINYTVSCATCVNPVATYAVRSDCINGPQFFVDVNITSLGSATSLTLTDNQGSASQTVAVVGLVSFGPFTNTTDVQITVSNDDDVNCEITSGSLTQPFCLENFVDCSVGPINTVYCYDDDGDINPEIILFTSIDGTPLNITFNSGNVEWNAFGNAPYDALIVLDSDGVTQLYNGGGNVGDLAGLTFQSTGGSISYYVESDFVTSCQTSSSINPIDVTVSCATCINPTATYSVIDDCATGQQFLIDVNVTSLGDATSVTITDNQGSPGVQVTATGIVQFGPYPFVTPIIITISNDQDVNCVINSAPIQVAACPPANDNCAGALIAVVNQGATCDLTTPGTILAATPSGVPASSCGGNADDDVWFQFTALHEVELISLINITGGTGDLDHAVYSGGCGGLTELYCSNETASVSPLLTVGATYYLRVFSFASLPESTLFDVCIQQAPANTICEQAANFCSNGSGSSGSNIIGFPGVGPVACLGSTPNPSWNIIQIGDPGLIEIEISQYDGSGNGLDVDFVIWGPFDANEDFCSLGLEVDCPSCPNNTTDPNFYPFGNIIDCSFDGAFIENLTIDNAQNGELYVLLVTNYSDDSGTITITQTNSGTGAGSTVADIQVDLGGDQTPCGVDSVVLTANSPFADTYEWYSDGFVIEGETGPTLTVTESNTYTVIVYDSQCGAFAQDEVTVSLGLEPVANPVANIVTCDDISGDGFEDFDLEAQTPVILGTQDPALYNVTYHLTQGDAIANVGALTSPYTNITNPQTIWVRIEDASSPNCSTRTSFDLVISGALPTATSVDIEVCQDASGGGSVSFDLAAHAVNILNGQSPTDFTVTYYATQADAEAGVSPLPSPYTNTSSPQTIWARVDNNLSVDCYTIVDFDLVAGILPVTSFSTDFNYEVCLNATVPIIITATPQNYTASDVSIVWYQDGGIISGQTGLTLPVLVGGTYTIQVTFNGTGCSDSVSQEVIQLDNCIIPQGISPDGDGKNDTFDLSNFDVQRIEIFNRLGTLVYSKDNYTNEWYGQSNNGDELPVGTYFYTMIYEGGAKQMSAWVYINK